MKQKEALNSKGGINHQELGIHRERFKNQESDFNAAVFLKTEIKITMTANRITRENPNELPQAETIKKKEETKRKRFLQRRQFKKNRTCWSS